MTESMLLLVCFVCCFVYCLCLLLISMYIRMLVHGSTLTGIFTCTTILLFTISQFLSEIYTIRAVNVFNNNNIIKFNTVILL